MKRTHTKEKSQSRKVSRKHNFYAGLTAALAMGFLYINSQPMVAGADPTSRADSAQMGLMNIPPAPPTAQIDESGEQAHNPHLITGELAIQFQVSLLESGLQSLMKVPEYTATFTKQELVANDLTPETTMQLKIRHEPFSVYMKWLNGDKGRELLYVSGKNKGKMLVHAGGWKANVLPTIKLDPTSSMAMSESRYPVTKAGLAELTRETLGYRKHDLKHPENVQCEVHGNQKFNKRPCYCVINTYKSKKNSELYRKTVMYLDKEMKIPVCVKNFTWPDEKGAEPDDKKDLIESYAYTNIKLRPQFADADFDKSNEKYLFK